MAGVTIRDVLAHLTFARAAKFLGPNGKHLLSPGSGWCGGEFDPVRDARFTADSLIMNVGDAEVTLSLLDATGNLTVSCSECHGVNPVCDHVVAAFSTILEEKTALGLAKPPPERVAVENLSETKLVERALKERSERARAERLRVTPPEKGGTWGDYAVSNPASGRSYRVSLRGWERGESFCECPDFRKNTLGTCKHIMRVLEYAKRRCHRKSAVEAWTPTEIEVFLNYSAPEQELRLNIPKDVSATAVRLLAPYRDKAVTDIPGFVKTLRKLADAGIDATVFPDAVEYIQHRLFVNHMTSLSAEIRKDPAKHPLRKTLLKTELLPYQLDGIAFAAGIGRAILADDMGLGKTIQGIGIAELLAREAGIRKVLVVCPASLKGQWAGEIDKFSNRDARLVTGAARERAEIYGGRQFFTICNYEQTLRDRRYIADSEWDLIILDEAQRVKNWEAATTKVIGSLKSRFALAITGTPMENRLEELFTVVSFVDDRRLGPAFRFLNQHRMTDEKGHVLGYRNMAELRERLKPILLRRTRDMVMRELPERHTEILRIAPASQQLDLHNANLRVVSQILGKNFISEMDLLRLRRALLMCRLAANGTYLVDKKKPGHSTKLDELESLLERLLAEEDRKLIVFSEWTTMLDLVEPVLKKHKAGFVRLDGKVPQTKRQALVNRFQKSADCPVFLATNAGSTGLNLQAANTVVNVDLPWNPAVLEQRIARAHRMGQKRPVQVYLLVTEDTLEERLLGVLGAKRDVALAALDPDSTVDAVSMTSGMDELKSRLELLLGRKPDAPVAAEPNKSDIEGEVKRRKIEESGGKLLIAAFDFLAELLPGSGQAGEGGVHETGGGIAAEHGAAMRTALDSCITKDEAGRFRFSVVLPDDGALKKFTAAITDALRF